MVARRSSLRSCLCSLFFAATVCGISPSVLPSLRGANRPRSLHNSIASDKVSRDSVTSLNEALQGMALHLPDLHLEDNSVLVDFSGLVCDDISFGEIKVDHAIGDAGWPVPESSMTVHLYDLQLHCSSNLYARIFGLTSNDETSLKMNMFAGKSHARAVLSLTSNDTEHANSTINSYPTGNSTDFSANFSGEGDEMIPVLCDVAVDKLELEGVGLLATLLSSLEPLIRDAVSAEVSKGLCDAAEFLAWLSPYLPGQRSGDDNSDSPNSTRAPPLNHTITNFKHPSTLLSKAASTVLELVDACLAAPLPDGDLHVNELLRFYLLDADDKLQLDASVLLNGGNNETLSFREGHEAVVFYEDEIPFGNVTAALYKVVVRGLDAFQAIKLSILDNHTLEVNMGFHDLVLELHTCFEVQSQNLPNASRIENITAGAIVQDMNIVATVELLLDEDILSGLSIADLLLRDDSLECLLSTMHQLRIVSLEVRTLDLAPPMIDFSTVSLTAAISALMNGVFMLAYPSFGPFLTDFIEFGFVGIFNDAVAELQKNVTCPPKLIPVEDVGLDMRNLFLRPMDAKANGATGASPLTGFGSIVTKCLYVDLLNVDQANQSSALNDIVSSASLDQSSQPGTLIFQDLFGVATPVESGGFSAFIELNVSELFVQNLDSFGPISILDILPDDSFRIKNSVFLAAPPKPLQLGTTFFFRFVGGNAELRNKMAITIELDSVHVAADLFLFMSEKNLLTYPIEGLLDTNCLLSLFPSPELDKNGVRVPWMDPSLSIEDLNIAIGGAKFNLTCLDCSGKDLEIINSLLELPGSDEETLQAIINLLDFASSLFEGSTSMVQALLDRRLVEGARQCPYSDLHVPFAEPILYEDYTATYEVSPLQYVAGALVAICALTCITFSLSVIFRWINARQQKQWFEKLPREKLVAIYRSEIYQRDKSARMNKASRSMFRSDEVHFFAKYLVPIVLLANIALFLSGQISIGGSFALFIQLGGQQLAFDDFYLFSVARIVATFWEAGAIWLAMAVFLASLLWPHVKQIITLWAWFAPPTRFSIERRGSVLLWLDFLARFSMLDMIVLIIAMVAFRITISSPSSEFLPTDVYRIDLLVEAGWGLYSNMTAQLLTQISSHFIIWYHRKIESAALLRFCRDHRALIEHDALSEGCASDSSAESEGTSHRGVIVRMPTEETTNAALPDDDSWTSNQIEKVDPVVGESACLSCVVGESACLSCSQVVEEDNSSQSYSNLGNASHASNARSTGPIPLCQLVFRRPDKGEATGLRLRRGTDVLFVFVAISAVALVVCGCLFDSYSTAAQGVIGKASDTSRDNGNSRQYHSLIDIVYTLMEIGKFLGTPKDVFGYACFTTLIFSTMLITPVLLTGALAIQWFLPMEQASRNKVQVAIEILGAWQYLEVYLLALVVGAWQLGDVADSISAEWCSPDDTRAPFSYLVLASLITTNEAFCFGMEVYIEMGMYMLVAAAILLTLLQTVVTLAFRQAQFQEQSVSEICGPQWHNKIHDDDDVPLEEIQPLPSMFSDRFRFLLERE